MSKIIWFCDGGYDNLRKRNGIYCIVNDNGFKRVQKILVESSNEAEYFAIIESLILANPGDTIYSDSQLIVNQLVGGWKVKSDNLYHFWYEACELIESKFKGNINITWIPRDVNKAGIILDREKRKAIRNKNKAGIILENLK